MQFHLKFGKGNLVLRFSGFARNFRVKTDEALRRNTRKVE